MSTDGIIFLGCCFMALGVALIYTTLTAPTKIRRARSIEDPKLRRYREVKLARSVPGGDSLAAMALDLGDFLAALFGTDSEDETTVRGQAIVQLLKAADWYWEFTVDNPPTPEAPFWSLPTYWSAKGAYTLLWAAIGLVTGGFVALYLDLAPALPIGMLVGAALGFTRPDDMLTAAARARQEAMTIELGFGVPRLHSIVQGDTSLLEGLRNLVSEPGEPFLEELSRVLVIYGVAHNLTAGLNEMIQRNTNLAVREFCTSMKMAVDRMGGNLGAALERQAARARDEMRWYVEKRSQANKRAATNQAVAFATILIFLLLIIPIALIVVFTMLGGSF